MVDFSQISCYTDLSVGIDKPSFMNDCSAFAAAIDKMSVSSPVSMQTYSTVNVGRKEIVPAASGLVLNATGGHFSNMTLNVMSPPIARKQRFCLSLKRRRERAAAKKLPLLLLLLRALPQSLHYKNEFIMCLQIIRCSACFHDKM